MGNVTGNNVCLILNDEESYCRWSLASCITNALCSSYIDPCQRPCGICTVVLKPESLLMA